MTTGTYSLGDITITAADTYVGDAVFGLDGMLAATVQLRFAYGADANDSPAVRAFVQTSLDLGNTWRDIACLLFGQSSETDDFNVSGLTPVTTPVGAKDGELSDDTIQDGILGDRFRLKVVSVGTYSNSTIVSGRVTIR